MSDDQLRAIYNARVTNDVPADRANCPTPEQLQRLAESGNGGSASNLTRLDHVFGCAYCRPEFALMRSVQTAFATHDRVGADVRGVVATEGGPHE